MLQMLLGDIFINVSNDKWRCY